VGSVPAHLDGDQPAAVHVPGLHPFAQVDEERLGEALDRRRRLDRERRALVVLV
jgi:hypothetical protein